MRAASSRPLAKARDTAAVRSMARRDRFLRTVRSTSAASRSSAVWLSRTEGARRSVACHGGPREAPPASDKPAAGHRRTTTRLTGARASLAAGAMRHHGAAGTPESFSSVRPARIRAETALPRPAAAEPAQMPARRCLDHSTLGRVEHPTCTSAEGPSGRTKVRSPASTWPWQRYCSLSAACPARGRSRSSSRAHANTWPPQPLPPR
mmetsp:Transcript_66877/g.211681  ORF Transcript_66877/g.211681 Transcript_66877/m.211681 type:complete len:207 (+) Transcript_66877:225-845(+)